MTANQIFATCEVIGLLIVLVGAYAAVRALAKAKGVEASISLLTTANEGLRSANEDFRNQLHAQELDCAKQIAELRGQVSVLTGSLARDIVNAVTAALPKGG